MIASLHESQEQFADKDMLRKVLEVGAGYAEFVPGTDGQIVAIPKSIAYDRLDQIEFKEVADKVFEYARSLRATRLLWPHLPDAQAQEMIGTIFREFE